MLSPFFERLAGTIETSTLRRANAVVYCIFDYPDGVPADETEARRILNQRLGQVHYFLLSAWLLKDNAVNIELGFLEWPHGDPVGSAVTSNARAIRFAKADGSYGDTEFTDAEAREARDICSKLFEANVVDQPEDHGYVVPEGFSRLSRVFYFAQAARGSSDLGDRIASYVTCFEALFCTDSSEIAHKLGERLAFFLGETPTRRLEIFRQMKAAYNIRSKVVHGDKIGRRLAENALAISAACDELLRAALIKILTTKGLPEVFSRQPEELERFFLGLVFGEHCGDDSIGIEKKEPRS
jgi:hypothetical protein